MPRKKKVEETDKNEILKGTEVSEETVSESTTKEMSFDEQYELAKKALVIKAFNVLTKIEDLIDMVSQFSFNEEVIRKMASLADNIQNDDGFKDKLIEAIVGDKDKAE